MKSKTRILAGHGDRPGARLVSARRERTEQIDNHRRPVWLEATESFYKKLNRIAKQCDLSRYEALSKGLDALLRETEVRNSALNRNIKSPSQSEVFRRTMGQVSRNYWANGRPGRKTGTSEEKCSSAMESACWRRTIDLFSSDGASRSSFTPSAKPIQRLVGS